jgi:predicted component of type VI protein secretion system
MTRVYLDAYCLSRLTDDQSQSGIKEEAETLEDVLAGVRRGLVELLTTEALEDEVRRSPSIERRTEAETTLSLGVTSTEIDEVIVLRARNFGAVRIWFFRCFI